MHYMNGRQANVGDPVVGTVFNHKGVVAGTLVSLTPGPDSCSAMVGFLMTTINGTLLKDPYAHAVRVQGTEQHGSGGISAVTFYKQDYTECRHLVHAEDARAPFVNPEPSPNRSPA